MPVNNLESDTNVAVSSWDLFVAAMTSDQDLRTNLISRVHNRASYNKSAGVFPTEYNSTNGSTILGSASPAQGAMYAPLALKAPVVHITTPTLGTSSRSRTGTVVGGVIGGVAVLLALGTITLVVRRRRRQSQERTSVIVTPLGPTESAYTEAVGPQTDRQQEMVPFIPDNSQRLSSGVVSIPVGLTGKELARLRSNGLRSGPMDRQPSDLSSDATPDTDARGSVAAETTPLPEDQRLWSEVDRLRHEIQQLRAARERSDAPPTYDSGEVAN